ncbi:TetR/AcrR family transcriptional regulator [Deefgea tanakiae]|jgi:TetR/AcrR family transcriptional repressor of mexJK operon|uniref:TetR/AcrR family transcriptional regulator n=1 Tax=Deefgea tanakiae TaxID=2865840 RepID=A0ABX8Z330_9NEIS|nr:TetR/AcrR family transcriptional regulator [Deefgea tanakiae]QZA76989.1 TetR/AcrR family transcriptional regulator [Deefgea tanakiae]
MNAASSKLTDSKRAQILSGARTMFMEHGFASTSVEKIAKAAGVSKGTIYNYFASKEILFVALITGECGGEAQLPEAAQLMAAPVENVLTQFGTQCLSGLLQEDQQRLFRIVLAEVMQFPQLGQLIESTGPALSMGVLTEYLTRLNQAGKLDIPQPKLAAEQFMAMCDAGIIRRMQLSVGNPSQAEIDLQVTSAVKLFMNGYAP